MFFGPNNGFAAVVFDGFISYLKYFYERIRILRQNNASSQNEGALKFLSWNFEVVTGC